jgi:predicted nucleic acid-binding protein
MLNSSMLCVDANLLVRLVTQPTDDAVEEHWNRWRLEGRLFAAPTLLHYEVTNALYQYQKLGLISDTAVRLAHQAALALPIELHGDESLHSAALALTIRFSLSASYDAHYLALAERLGVELWTVDERLWRRVRGELPWVRLVPRGGQVLSDDDEPHDS